MASLKESQIIEKLNSSNYSHWKLKLEMLLIKEDLFKVVTETPPTTNSMEWMAKERYESYKKCCHLKDKKFREPIHNYQRNKSNQYSSPLCFKNHEKGKIKTDHKIRQRVGTIQQRYKIGISIFN